MRLIWITVFAVVTGLAALLGWMQFIAPPKITTLTVAAGERGSDSHVLMREISEVLRRHSSQVRLDVLPSRSASSSISRINSGEVDLATIQSNTPAYTNINVVADLFADYFLLITREQTPTQEQRNPLAAISDLRKRRIVIPESGTVANLSFWSVIDHYKLPPQGFVSFAMPRAKAIEAFLTGQVEAIFFVSSLRDPTLLSFIEEAGLRNIPLNFLPIDQAEAMTLKRPYLLPARIVKGAFDGRLPLPREDVSTPTLHRLLVSGADVDEDAIYELVETVFENRLDLLIRMALSSAMRDPRQEGTATLPIHPGAERFFDRDQPSFLQENAEPMALFVTVMAMIISALVALRRSLQARAKNRGDGFNVDMLNLANRAKHAGSLGELDDLRGELDTALEKAVNALDTDKVTEEGFQSFAFLWRAAQDALNARHKALS